MWNSLCFLITVLVGASHQRTTVLTTSNTEDNSNSVSRQVFVDYVDPWQKISSTNESTVSPAFTTDEPSKKCQQCTCGVLEKPLGIVGGNATDGYKYPWMASIWFNNKFMCGGSLINNKYVMTAAHCVFKRKEEEFTVQLLRYNNSADHDEHIDLNVKKIILHKQYDAFTLENDIALLRLDSEDLDIDLKSKIRPVCLPHAGENFVDYNATVTGWGATKERGKVSSVLREVSVPIISNEECRKYWRYSRITDYDMCAGYKKGGKAACSGDSGGPLLVNNNSIYYVVGIVSWSSGAKCGRPDTPTVYIRVNMYLDWLAYHTKDACLCSEQ